MTPANSAHSQVEAMMNAGAGGGLGGGGDPVEWYLEIPPVSRAYLTLSFLATAACALDIVSPFSLYFNLKLIVEKAQLWRLLTNFFFFGLFSLDFVFHMYFLMRYCRLLEEDSFAGRTADFVWFLCIGVVLMTLCAPFVNVHFLGSSLTFMMVYVWSRRNEHVRMSFLGIFPFTAPYLPWVLLGMSVLLGNSATVDMMGIATGHVYNFAADVYPKVAEVRQWRVRHLVNTPTFLRMLCGELADEGVPAVRDAGPTPNMAAAQGGAAGGAEGGEGGVEEVADREGYGHAPARDAAAAVDDGDGMRRRAYHA